MPHQMHLQHRLLPCTAYTIIAKHKQIGWANKLKHMHQFIYQNTHNPRILILRSHITWPPPCNPCSTSLVDNLKLSLLSILQATTCRTYAGTLVIPCHNSKSARVTFHSESQLQEYSNIWPLRYRPKPRRPRTSKARKTQRLLHQKLPSAPHESPGAKGFQTAWPGTRVASR